MTRPIVERNVPAGRSRSRLPLRGALLNLLRLRYSGRAVSRIPEIPAEWPSLC